MLFSVIICTHNPRADYLRRTLGALQAQTLSKAQWELLLIDNASTEPLTAAWDLGWHPQARIIREDELGLTPARLRGIRESTGEVLVFVDDDNVLAPDYLAQAGRLLEAWPMLGAIGGSISGCFEVPPPASISKYVGYLAISEIQQSYWSNIVVYSNATPVGAGMCVRRQVAQDYQRKVVSDPLRNILDRKGRGLMGCGDFDLVFCATALGFGAGRFPELKLEHLIGANRLTEDYIAKLVPGCSASGILLKAIWEGKAGVMRDGLWRLARFIGNWLRAKGFDRRVVRECYLAENRVLRILRRSVP